MKLLKGDIVHAPALGALETIPDGALLLDDDGTICEYCTSSRRISTVRYSTAPESSSCSRSLICICTRRSSRTSAQAWICRCSTG
ncbi:MAG: hypothetical protein ACLR4Z_08025 [Butyricicoccaceae bacterium]